MAITTKSSIRVNARPARRRQVGARGLLMAFFSEGWPSPLYGLLLHSILRWYAIQVENLSFTLLETPLGTPYGAEGQSL